MQLSTLLVAAAACVSTANAHVALWDKGMFGLNWPYQADDPQNHNYNNNQPVNPLRQADSLSTAQWFGHGLLGYPPKSGDFMVLPSGGTYNGEVSCNRAQTSLGNPSDTSAKYQYACKVSPSLSCFGATTNFGKQPDGGQYSGVGALHVMNTYNGSVDNSLFGGTALAIAYTSDPSSLSPNDMTVISVNQNSVWEREISYQIPAGLPPCPEGGCICTWNWIHQGGKGEGYPYEIYNVAYRCQVTGQTNSANTVQRGAVPNKCDNNPSKCVKGPKTPMYLWQADGNNLPNLDTPPNYRDNWGFADGAQNDIFQVSSNPAGASDTYVSTTNLPDGWSAVGCMIDTDNPRALPGVSTTDANNNTIENCVAKCNDQGYVFAGLEYGKECWCSNTASLNPAPATDCSMTCSGDIHSTCGGSYRINVYRSADAPATGQATPLPDNLIPDGWSSVGCIVDDQSDRALNGGAFTSTNNTVQNCVRNCASRGYAYAGVEYGQECWCGDANSRLVSASSGCDVACTGDKLYVCGGSDRLNVYALIPNITSTSAFASATVSTSTSNSSTATSTSIIATTTNSSVIPTSSTAAVTNTSSSSILTTASSTAPASSSSSSVALSTSSAPASSSASSSSISSVSVAVSSPSASSSTSSSSTLSSTASSASSSSRPTLASSSSSAPATSVSSSTTVLASTTSTSSMASSTSISSSSSTQAPTSSATSTSFTSTSSVRPSSSAASSTSSISTASVKPSSSSTTTSSSTTSSTTTSAAAAATTSLPAGWISRGCYADSSSKRVLNGNIFESKPDMTYASCIAICVRKGYTMAGVEYGTQCFCGTALVSPSPAANSECNRPCSGDSKAMCGGYNRISILQNSQVSSRRAMIGERDHLHIKAGRRRIEGDH
ncbi:hypothetical protein I204_00332 [Kwoniella mangroviensis CBS 8886]|nr:hypothetical protein I204_00332 [Kwoniella mangroviensis CBS 8886]